MSASTQYLNQLTWLRGFAAFIVIISHTIRGTEVAYTADEETPVYLLASAFDTGGFGVILFFALSGATLYVSSRGQTPSTFKFYVKRFFRIWPAFVVAMLAYMAFSIIFRQFYVEPQGHWVERQFLTDFTAADVVAYLTMTFNYVGQYGLFNNAFWSLPVEFQFYLLFPLIVYLLKRLGIAGPVLVGSALIAFNFFFDIPDQSSAFFRLAYSFCGGVILGHIYLTTTKRYSGYIALILLPLSYTIMTLITRGIVPMPKLPFIDQIYNWSVFFALVCIGVCMFTRMSLPKKIQGWLEYYGTISYSTYLYHNLVIGAVVLLLIHLDINDGLLRYLIMLISTLLITHLLAVISYKVVERPSMLLGRKLAQ